jgi:hypothetical protein
MDKFGYIGIDIGMSVFWLLLYVRADIQIKKTMIKHGIYGGIVTILTEHIFIKDYWIPPPISGVEGFYAIEDFLYGFFIVGISSTIYDQLFHIKKIQNASKQRVVSYLFVFLVLGMFMLLSKYYGYNSTCVISLALLVATCVMVLMRKDLFYKAWVSGITLMLILFGIYLILFNLLLTGWWYRYWLLTDTPYAYYLLNIPWIEYVWYFSLGAFMSIISDFSHGRTNIRQK